MYRSCFRLQQVEGGLGSYQQAMGTSCGRQRHSAAAAGDASVEFDDSKSVRRR